MERNARSKQEVASALALLLTLASCTSDSSAPPPADEPPVAAPPDLTEVRLPLLQVADAFKWDTEFRGLATMAIEIGLSDLPGVVVRVPGDIEPPSVLTSLPASRRQVDARLSCSGPADALELELELCVAGEGCASSTATGTREAPWEAFATLLEGAANTLGVEPTPETLAGWRQPGSKDPYAELVTGRSAATLYGILPPPTDPADRAKNPVLRAVYLDPRQPLALWSLARWEVGTTSDGGKAVDLLTRAGLVRPWSPILDADLGTVLAATGKSDQAMLAWEHVRERNPMDPRFLEPAARALLVAGRPADARAVLETFPPEFRWEPRVAELQVGVAEALDGAEGLDPLLAHWQDTDGRAVEPVRRRLDLRVQRGRYDDALTIVPALRSRAPGAPTDALEVALLVAVGRLREAADEAPPDVAARLDARIAREQDPGSLPDIPEAGPLVGLARADAYNWKGEAANALHELDPVLKEWPYSADALAARARALERMGRTDAAAESWERAWEADPGLEGGSVATTRIASTFQYVVSEAPVTTGTGVGKPAVGAKGPEL